MPAPYQSAIILKCPCLLKSLSRFPPPVLSVLTPVFYKHSLDSSTFQSSPFTSSKIPPTQATSMMTWPWPICLGILLFPACPCIALKPSVCVLEWRTCCLKEPTWAWPLPETWCPPSLQSSQSGCDDEQLISRSQLWRVLFILIHTSLLQDPTGFLTWQLYFRMFREHLILT